MPNLPTILSTSKDEIIDILDQFQTFKVFNTNTADNYHITEYFPSGKRSYDLLNLIGIIDGQDDLEVISFSDDNNKLSEDTTRVLNLIQINQVQDIIRYYAEENHTYNSIIILRGGCILIETDI